MAKLPSKIENRISLAALTALILPLSVLAMPTKANPNLGSNVPSYQANSGKKDGLLSSNNDASSINDPQSDDPYTDDPYAPNEKYSKNVEPPKAMSGEVKHVFYKAVILANQRSPTMGRARAMSEAALGNVDEAKGQRWPQVDVAANSKQVSFGGGTNRRNQDDMPTVQVSVVTSVYDFGQLSDTITSREKTAEAASIGVVAESENTAWEVSRQLIELSKQRQIIMLSKQYVARMQELTTMLSGIVQADPGRRSELTQARGQLLQAQTLLDLSISKTKDIEIALYKYLGDSKVALPQTPIWALDMPQLESQLKSLNQHPIVRKAQAETDAALAEASAVRSSGLPKLNWVVSKNTAKDEYGHTEAFQTGLQVHWGAFRGGSTVAAERAALMRAEASRQQVEEQQLDLEYRVRAAVQDATSLLGRSKLYHNLVIETNRIRLDFFDQWYHLGKRTLLDVLSAESNYYGNEVNEVSSRFDGYAAIFRGHASAGELVNWLKQST